VGVGRFTSPDTMAGQIRRGVLDLIGAARPSIADPFLPSKIDAGREQDIRECIGCNICISSWHDSVPVRCTQNPTIGEEWRREWHPERVAPAGSSSSVLIVGGGPSGLECALTLARRGYEVTLAEAADDIGGRLRFETRLPGLSSWGRVLDWRRGQLEKLPNFNLYRGNRLSADEILELGNTHVVIATGAHWSRMLYSPLEIPVGTLEGPNVHTPDDIAAGVHLEDPVVVFDFDNYYMGSAVAEYVAKRGHRVSYVTPAGHASAWAIMSNEQPQIHRALADCGITLHTLSRVTGFKGSGLPQSGLTRSGPTSGVLTLASQFTDKETHLVCGSLIIVGARFPNDALYHALIGRPDDLASAGIASVTRVGDALAPGAIVHAVYSGHRYARELDADPQAAVQRRDTPLREAPPSAHLPSQRAP
jgi:dimethylamine/trimethylamine dehydrogenase